MLTALHLTNLRKAEGYFEIKKRNYQIDTPCDLANDVISQFETCNLEKEIAQKTSDVFKNQASRFYYQIDQKITMTSNKIKVQTAEVQLIKDLLLKAMKQSEKGDENSK